MNGKRYRVWRTFYAAQPCGITHDARWFRTESAARREAVRCTHIGTLKIRNVVVDRFDEDGDREQVAYFSKDDLRREQDFQASFKK